MERIFTPFEQQGDEPDSRNGTGLGLAITRQFVKMMKGEISVQSQPGQGAVFTFSVRVQGANKAAPETTRTETRQVIRIAPGQKIYRILVAEDNPDNRLLVRTLLEQAGFAVREAVDGEEAMVLFKQWRPHFIWMDMRMPVMDGYEAAKHIRRLPGGDSVAIVALTASAFQEQHQQILAAGCNEVLHKPFRAEELFYVMGKYLGVRYDYKEKQQIQAEQSRVICTTAMMQGLSAEQQERLRSAAHKLDIAASEEVIEELRHGQPEIADELQRMVQEFRFGDILNLLRK
ncbi:MAG: response regulator [Candidatus Electrothrix sp. AUS4]|nr:response regulator [Candidatus Electrothrix sp. AUS4]